MSNNIAVDTYALLVWIKQEKNYEAYRSFFSGNWQGIITPIVLFELKLAMLKAGKKLDEQITILAYVKTICDVVEVSESVALRAAELKYKYKNSAANLSMADAIAIALAESLGTALLSGEKGLYNTNEVAILPEKS